MKAKKLFGLLLSVVALFAAGCGGGGGAGVSGPAVTGVASKGPISGGTVEVFRIISGARQSSLGTTTTAADGSYTFGLPAGVTKGSLLVKVTGGTYTDEATGAKNVSLATQAPNGLTAVFSNISGVLKRGAVTACPTPVTDL